MRFLFDPNQPHQLSAIEAICGVLEGQSRCDTSAGEAQVLTLDSDALLTNIKRVQRQRQLQQSESYLGPELSVEMETGTGKTYAYLRTIRELKARFNFNRFVVVVPTIAIREGVLQQSDVLREHFDELYPSAPVVTRLYRPNRLSELRHFSTGGGAQLLVINIDAFNKTKHNLIHRPSDALNGHSPLSLISRCCPFVILDEPQNMGSPKAKEAIASLNPLMTLRYSATHRELFHRVERLSPVDAYDQGLVKRIEVLSVQRDGVERPPQLRVLRVRATTRSVSARLAVETSGPYGPVPKTITVRGEAEDLAHLTGRAVYRGYQVEEISAADKSVRFANGVVLSEGADLAGPLSVAEMQAQIRETVRLHLEHELHMRLALKPSERMKVLSLFFVDRVARFVSPDGEPGVAQRWFKEAYSDLSAQPEFGILELPSVDDVMVSYFAQQRGRPVDTSGVSRDDDKSYALIMRDKAQLLDQKEPARFIFSHSALREGWDNPNVFQICTLHRTRSELRKRQEIGRGLRLPVMVNGQRCHDPEFTRLVVVANDTYEAFADRLQQEVADDAGVSFSGRIRNRRIMTNATLRPGALTEPTFEEVWGRIGRPLRWVTTLDTEALITHVTSRASSLGNVGPLRLRHRRLGVRQGQLVTRDVSMTDLMVETHTAQDTAILRDPIATLQHETGLTRSTLNRLLRVEGLYRALLTDPERVVQELAEVINTFQSSSGTHGGRLEARPERLAVDGFRTRPPRGPVTGMIPLNCGPYTAVPLSNEESRKRLVEVLKLPNITCVLPWPHWHRPQFAGASYDPGWVVVQALNEGPRVELWPLLDRSVDLEIEAWYKLLADAVGLHVRWS